MTTRRAGNGKDKGKGKGEGEGEGFAALPEGLWVLGSSVPCLRGETWGTRICGAEEDFLRSSRDERT